ncbi:hypothetical protein B0T22DRAFT_524309 [Podospora appendiculata]|uniref:Uncharacterized protein n=1 Tax=Podospora appendiculata TaxID=314037 RepID=A0AAE1C730_9PEZI|nr:hypothetical protein B0T22DRAFT_524309 [Podospora appendiculata]
MDIDDRGCGWLESNDKILPREGYEKTITLIQPTTEYVPTTSFTTTVATVYLLTTLTTTEIFSPPLTVTSISGTIWETVTEEPIALTETLVTWISYEKTIIATQTTTVYESPASQNDDSTSQQSVSLTFAITGVIPEMNITSTRSPTPLNIPVTDERGSISESVLSPAPEIITSIIPAQTSSMVLETAVVDASAPVSFTIRTTKPESLVTRTRSSISAISSPQTLVVSQGGVTKTLTRFPPPFFVHLLFQWNQGNIDINSTTRNISGSRGRVFGDDDQIPNTRHGVETVDLATVVVSPTSVAPETGSSWITIIEIPPPSTYVTDVSGSPRTMITTPPPSTHISTMGWSSRTLTITRSAGGSTDDNGTTNVIVDTATYSLTPAEYFSGAFLPTIIAMLLGIPLSLININAKILQPFHALTRDGGASAADSLLLTYSGVLNSVNPSRTITSLLTWCSWFLVPLASEAVGLKVHGHCSRYAIDGCAIARGIALLATNQHIRTALYRLEDGETIEKAIKRSLENKRFKIGESEENYGIVPAEEESEELSCIGNNSKKQRGPFVCLIYEWRIAFVALHLVIIALIAFYLWGQSKGEKDILDFGFGFGFRFLFAAIGQVISLFWSELFFQCRDEKPIPPNAAAMAILAKFLPILLSNIAYTLHQTYASYLICARTSIGVLSAMSVALLGSLFVLWPYLPVDPRTILVGLSTLAGRERDLKVVRLGNVYVYGRFTGVSGRSRMGVYAEPPHEISD